MARRAYEMNYWQTYRLTVCGCLLMLWVAALAACSKPGDRTDNSVDYWTCGMHPSIHEKAPGKCPICGMDLVPVKPERALSDLTNIGQSQGREFSIPVERQQRIGVVYAEVEPRRIRFDLRAVGTLEADQGQILECVARVDGYIEGLQVTSPGERVTGGQPLMTIYSPDLRAPQQELINLLKAQAGGSAPSASMDPLIDLARRRLQFLNVGDSEISELERTGQPTDRLLFRSPGDGVVSEAPMKVGMGVKRGDKLMTVVNLSRLWLWANFYENEVELLREGLSVTVILPAFPGRKFEGQIGAINPSIDPVKGTTIVRVDVPNQDRKLRPGMYANVIVNIDAGAELAIPFDSVLPTGSRMLVFVDKGSGRLEPRFIQVGRQFVDSADPNQGRYYQLTAGLRQGERIVSGANFLIDAEAQIQGVLRDFGETTTIRAER
jgi:membrane fusion protein, copper/silver efflux system